MPSSTGFKQHRVFSWMYPRMAASMMARGQAEHREELLAGLQGRVIEVGAGNGLNFGCYPATVTEVVAIEPEHALRRLAEKAAVSARIPVTVIDGVAESLPAEDGEFDAGVASLVLCSVGDLPGALAELHRVIRPGGELRFYEHVAAEEGSTASRFQRVMDATIWPTIGAGCHLHRPTVEVMGEMGFVVEECEVVALGSGPGARVMSSILPMVLGRARRR